MKNVFDVQTINEFKQRINALNANSQAKWGKMTVYQMLKHCTENEKLMLQERKFKRVFLGRIFGKMALKASIKDAKPFSHNSPTHPDLVIKSDGDVEKQKDLWIEMLSKYPKKTKKDFIGFLHPFFGKMDKEQVNKWTYKHVDHHLRQFGV